jgi:hypothetical protein
VLDRASRVSRSGELKRGNLNNGMSPFALAMSCTNSGRAIYAAIAKKSFAVTLPSVTAMIRSMIFASGTRPVQYRSTEIHFTPI